MKGAGPEAVSGGRSRCDSTHLQASSSVIEGDGAVDTKEARF